MGHDQIGLNDEGERVQTPASHVVKEKSLTRLYKAAFMRGIAQAGMARRSMLIKLTAWGTTDTASWADIDVHSEMK